MPSLREITLSMTSLAMVMAAIGCEGSGPAGGRTNPAGSSRELVIVDGSSTVFRISRVAQESFNHADPKTTVVVNVQGTGGGFRNYLAGKTDVVDASRPANKAEQAKIDANPELACTRFIVGHDGITVVVNPKNTFVKSLTVAQLKALWQPGSKVKAWNDLDPAWPKREIQLYCPDNASGTFDYFTEAIVGKEKQQRDDAQASPDDNVLVTGVESDEDAIGYFGYAYYKANAQHLRAVPIQDGPAAPAVAPSHETILAGTYKPLSRPLFIYVKHASLKRPAVAAFVKHYLDGAAAFAEKAGYVAPTESELAANKQALEAALGGTTPSR